MHEKTALPPPLAVSIREACRLSGLGRTKIYELISDGRLTPVKIDRRTLIPFDDLAKLVSPDRSALAVEIRPPLADCAKAATSRLISAASPRLIGITSTPTEGATDWMTANWPMPATKAGSRRTAARVTPGAISLSNSGHFPHKLYSNIIKPVALPPGCERLWTKPEPTGSGTSTKTIGTVRVASSTEGISISGKANAACSVLIS